MKVVMYNTTVVFFKYEAMKKTCSFNILFAYVNERKAK